MRAKRLLRRVGQALRSLLIILIAIPLCGSLYIAAAKHLFGQKNPTFFGFTASIVLTGSMSGAIESNDVVVTRQQDSYAVGDIITFSAEGTSVTHRIAAADGEGYRTKGDANNAADQWPVAQEDVVGKVIFVIPKVGALLTFLRTPLGILCFLGLIVLIAELPGLISSRHTKKRHPITPERRRKNGTW